MRPLSNTNRRHTQSLFLMHKKPIHQKKKNKERKKKTFSMIIFFPRQQQKYFNKTLVHQTDCPLLTTFETKIMDISTSFFSDFELLDFQKGTRTCCQACNNFLFDAFQTGCGHVICRFCCEKSLDLRCPVGEETCISLQMGLTVQPDFAIRKSLSKAKAKCVMKRCGQELPPEDFVNHRCPRLCRYSDNGCSETKYDKREIEEHEKTCDFRIVQCDLCKESLAHNALDQHRETLCKNATIPCPNSCGTSLPRLLENLHLEGCEMRIIPCPFSSMGCVFQGPAKSMSQHEADSVAHHCFLNSQCLESMKESSEKEISSQKEIFHLKSAVETYRNESAKNQKLYTCLSAIIAEQKDQIADLMWKVQANQKIVATVRQQSLVFQDILENNQFQSDRCKIDSLKEDVEKIRTEFSQTQRTVNSGSSDERSLDDRSLSLLSDVSQHDRLLSLFNVRLAEVDLRLQMLETASYNGSLMWKIRGYSRRKGDATSGKTISLYSQPFYTEPHGYKLCARIYLNGDGMGKGTHVSLFFVVMKGDYDALLPWPFRKKVTMQILDQVGNRHLQDTFRPDPTSSSFQRPQNEMNIASGCPLFVSHSVFEAHGTPYIRDETIFVKVTVDRDTDRDTYE